VKRSAVLPEVPTVGEAGVKDYEATIWLGVMTPAGTPRAVIDRLNAEVTRVATRPDVRKVWNEQGAEPMSMNAAEFEKYLNDDIAKWARVVKASGARPD
jgi:tripartite-type tricarboxylate transporter receptor subunit TctC